MNLYSYLCIFYLKGSRNCKMRNMTIFFCFLSFLRSKLTKNQKKTIGWAYYGFMSGPLYFLNVLVFNMHVTQSRTCNSL